MVTRVVGEASVLLGRKKGGGRWNVHRLSREEEEKSVSVKFQTVCVEAEQEDSYLDSEGIKWVNEPSWIARMEQSHFVRALWDRDMEIKFDFEDKYPSGLDVDKAKERSHIDVVWLGPRASNKLWLFRVVEGFSPLERCSAVWKRKDKLETEL
ncbi:hypothetical protein Tco_0127546 [Tanacetum coccineum]